MKKIFPYFLCLFLVLCTACNTDDTVIPSYTQITKEQKALLLGDWQLSTYSNSEGEAIDLMKKGIWVNYKFTSEGRVEIRNHSSKPIQLTNDSFYLTSDGTLDYTFEYIKQWDKTIPKKEHLYFQTLSDVNLQFDLEVTKDKLILTHYAGETLVFKKIQQGVTYPKIPEENKKILLGTWRLKEVSDFSGRRRIFSGEEDVLYEFGYGEKLFVQNNSTPRDGRFDVFIQSRVSDYYYQYDFEWEEQEILIIEDLGGYVMGITQESLVLFISDGFKLKLERVN